MSFIVVQIAREMEKGMKWLTCYDTFYNNDRNELFIIGWIIKTSSKETNGHMLDKAYPKSTEIFTIEKKKIFESIKTHNLSHNLAASCDQIK